MVERFGGIQGFVAAWIEQIDRARQERPGGKKVLDFFMAITRMIETCQPAQPDVDDMSREELQHELMEHTKHLIQQQPELVVHAAE